MIDSKYLHKILDKVAKISEGDYTARIDIIPGQPELSAIAKGINKLNEKLESARKEIDSERDLLRSKKRDLGRLMESLQTGVLIVDVRSNDIIFLNRKAADTIGQKKKEILGNSISKYLSIESNTNGRDFDSDQDYHKHYLINSQGEKIRILISSVRIIYEGRPVLLNSFIDISKGIETEKRLKESEKDFFDTIELMPKGIAISKYNEAEDDFYFTRFNRYAQSLEGMEETYVIGKSMKQLFPAVVEYGLFDKMKSVLKTGKPEVFPLALYKDENMCAYRENYIYQLTNGSIVCVYDDLTEKKKLENELKVSQERYNLAIKFTPDGGLIEIIGEASPEGTRISIRDNGVGIKKENLEKLFRVDNNFSTNGTNNEEGTGLGLVLCKEFIHKNHGKYSIESEPGKGTTFSFVLPAKEMQSMEKSA